MSKSKTARSYNAYAKKWVRRIRDGENIALSYLEKPAMHAAIPDLRGKSVLCLGCGSGDECAYLASRGAKRIVGIDISSELIETAKHTYPELEFLVMDMRKLPFEKNSFDFVYSSLALHYVKDWGPMLRSIHRILRRGGVFLFSTIHPLKWGASTVRGKRRNTFMIGYEKHKGGIGYKVYGDYLNERKIFDKWFDDFAVSYYHKPFSRIFSDIFHARFSIIDFLEPKPIANVKRVKNNFWHIHQKIPLFVILKLKKEG